MDAPVRALHDTLEDLPEPPAVAIAFSGGRDSTALLHAAVAVRDAGLVTGLRALHVDHGLHPDASLWRERCATFCDELAVPYTALVVAAEAAKGESPEAAAREARYAALAAELGSGEWLLTAHHRDDQAETLLLQLLRGSGVAGLAAMPARAPFASGWLVRPLLELDRASLAVYARDHRLDWSEDPSNAAVESDRNFLRHEIMPRLASRWPAATDCMARSAAHCAEADDLLGELASRELSALALPGQPEVLPVDGLLALPADRRRLLLRHWLVTLGLTRPGHRVLARIEHEALVAATDRNPVVTWSGGEVRRHRNTLHALIPATSLDPTPLSWDPADELELPWGVLAAEAVTGAGLAQARLRGQRLTVRTRTGGERLRLPGRPTRTLKKLLQEAGVPTWRRAGLPLVYVGEELVAVADMWIAEGYEASDGNPGWRLHWRESDPPGMPEKCVFD